MNTNNQTPEQQQKKENQLIFVHYEKLLANGHKMTVTDRYRNDIAIVYQSYNKELNKYEFTAKDHNGNVLFVADQLWKIEKEFINQREKFLEEAHQRRIAAKQKKEAENQTQEKTNAVSNEQQPNQTEQRNAETKELRNKKTAKQQNKETEIER